MWHAPIYRKSYKKRYGSRCFLSPQNEKYPICNNGKIDCKGLRAAAYYIRLNKYKSQKNIKNIKKKAVTLKRKYCSVRS